MNAQERERELCLSTRERESYASAHKRERELCLSTRERESYASAHERERAMPKHERERELCLTTQERESYASATRVLFERSQDAHREVTHHCHVLLLSYYCSVVGMGSRMESVW